MQEALLSLHYVYPLTMNKWQRLQMLVGNMDNFSNLTTSQWAQIFNITPARAAALKNDYLRISAFPLAAYYAEANIEVITYFDARYPPLLRQLYDAPAVLYAKGDAALLQTSCIAIIGSRHATVYSKKALDYIVPPLVAAQQTIVSGLAAGADRFAHEAALHYGGRTIAVLGHGLQHCYPQSNAALFAKLAENELVITEYPPYRKPAKWQFPMRNRIISGISRALVVTEAALRSGTLITTDQALEQGKDVFAVPGPIDSELSRGTNQLIKDGAIVAWNGYDIMNELRINSN